MVLEITGLFYAKPLLIQAYQIVRLLASIFRKVIVVRIKGIRQALKVKTDFEHRICYIISHYRGPVRPYRKENNAKPHNRCFH